MGWTDERVETLKRLWLDGVSASHIAKHLGGVTRNAVIGKVHRLGLSGRAAPSQPPKPVFKTPRPARPPTGAIPAARQPGTADAFGQDPVAEAEGAAAPTIMAESAEVDPREVQAAAVHSPEAAAVEVLSPEIQAAEIQAADLPAVAPEGPAPRTAPSPERGVATVLSLGAHMCKWPIGDPSTDDFGFCGRRAPPEGPYCVEHARVAYQQPQQVRKKASASELARSLRRYV
jgi:GcrA cell cycle regulator